MKTNKIANLSLALFAFAQVFVVGAGVVAAAPQPYLVNDGSRFLQTFAQEEPPVDDASSLKNNPIVIRLIDVLNFLIYGVGLVVTATIIISGIQYMISQGNPQKTAAARDRIIMALIGLALYSMAFVILQWLIPGGVFTTP